MTIAQNIKELHEGGYVSNAYKMAENLSVSVEKDFKNENSQFEFEDKSIVVFCDSKCEVI